MPAHFPCCLFAGGSPTVFFYIFYLYVWGVN